MFKKLGNQINDELVFRFGDYGMELIGQIPLWAFLLGGLIIVVIAWKVIKFAIKLFVALLVFFGILIGLDMLNVFQIIQDIISGFF